MYILYIHTYTHTYVHTYIHTYIRIYVPISLTSEEIIQKWRQPLRLGTMRTARWGVYSEGGGVPFGSDNRPIIPI